MRSGRRPVRHGLGLRRRRAAADQRWRRAADELEADPGLQELHRPLKSPPHNTVDGVHYGVSLQWGPNTLLYNTTKVKPAPTSWAVLYNPKYKGQITIPDNPIQIADAALYLTKSKPDLGIKDPYELTKTQFDAAVNAAQAAAAAREEVLELGVGRDRPVQERRRRRSAPRGRTRRNTLAGGQGAGQGAHPHRGRDGLGRHLDARQEGAAPELRVPVDEVRHRRRRSQAQQAIVFGETPVNPKACPFMNKLQTGSCAQYHAGRAGFVLRQRSSSGRRRSRTAATARTTAWTTTPGSKPGREITGLAARS